MSTLNAKFQTAFEKCVEKSEGKELDTIECFEQYCQDQVVDPVEQDECFAQSKFIERCQTCSELKLEEFHEKKGILDPEITSKICAECITAFAGFEQPFELEQFLNKIVTSDSKKLTKYDFSENSNCATIDTCTKIDLSKKNISVLPLEIKQFQQLQELILGRNDLKTLPHEIGDLTQLKLLGLSNNELQNLPLEIGKLTQLKELNLNNNPLESLPTEIGNLKQLQELWLNSNELKILPLEIGNLTQLQVLALNNNNLWSLPAEIGKLKKLKELALSGNGLQKLPLEIGNLQQLENLDLYWNDLKWLPKKIKKLTSLNGLNTMNNYQLPKEQQVSTYDYDGTQQFLKSL